MIKHSHLSKRKGLIFKAYKEFEVFLLSNGMILFYTQTEKSKKFGQESVIHRMHLDETIRIEDVQKETVKVKNKNITRNVTRFTIRMGKTSVRLESETSDNWVNVIQNFDF